MASTGRWCGRRHHYLRAVFSTHRPLTGHRRGCYWPSGHKPVRHRDPYRSQIPPTKRRVRTGSKGGRLRRFRGHDHRRRRREPAPGYQSRHQTRVGHHRIRAGWSRGFFRRGCYRRHTLAAALAARRIRGIEVFAAPLHRAKHHHRCYRPGGRTDPERRPRTRLG